MQWFLCCFFFSFFSFWGKMIWMNYPVTRIVRVQHFKAKRVKSVIWSFSKHAYITATVPVTVIPKLLSYITPWKDFMCEVCSRFHPEHEKRHSEISPLYSITRIASTLWDYGFLSQYNELPDREETELQHSKTQLFPVTTTENSHAPVF